MLWRHGLCGVNRQHWRLAVRQAGLSPVQGPLQVAESRRARAESLPGDSWREAAVEMQLLLDILRKFPADFHRVLLVCTQQQVEGLLSLHILARIPWFLSA